VLIDCVGMVVRRDGYVGYGVVVGKGEEFVVYCLLGVSGEEGELIVLLH
jgi:hypothetical protein